MRIKISFKIINGNNYTVIPPEIISESRIRIAYEMKKFKFTQIIKK